MKRFGQSRKVNRFSRVPGKGKGVCFRQEREKSIGNVIFIRKTKIDAYVDIPRKKWIKNSRSSPPGGESMEVRFGEDRKGRGVLFGGGNLQGKEERCRRWKHGSNND